MSIKVFSSDHPANLQSSVFPNTARARQVEAVPKFLKLPKGINCSSQLTRLRCLMNQTNLQEDAIGMAQKDGVIIVDHGSHRQESNLLLNEFVNMFRNKTGYSIVEPAHMELAEPSIKDAFGSCVQQGANRVIISPFFLFPGRHWHQDVVKDRIDYCLSHVAGKVDECAVCAGSGRCKIKVQDS